MAEKTLSNKDRLLRAIRCLQLLQRTNAPNSAMAKAVTLALKPLLKEMASLPAEAEPMIQGQSS